MPKIEYTPKRFNPEHRRIVEQANEIITAYAAQGYDLTLRQLYYQFVARDWFPASWQDATTGSTNNERSYKKLGTIVSDARRAGLIDWDRIVDRTRVMRRPTTWADPAAIVAACAAQYAVDLWEDQDTRAEVWVEKDALVGVLEVACEPWQCPYFSCRGFASDSAVWGAAQRLSRVAEDQRVVIFHLGDHDPSGIDMTRDIEDRVRMFVRTTRASNNIEVRRIALNMDQIEVLNPPPNPAKETDSRFKGYRERFGDQSWELDALDPAAITELIAENMRAIVDEAAWAGRVELRDEGRRLLSAVSAEWDGLTAGL